MRVLVVYSHPVESSYNAALHSEVVSRLKKAGHEVDDCNLVAEDFNPVLSRAERLNGLGAMQHIACFSPFTSPPMRPSA